MAFDLGPLVEPTRTALVTVELQRNMVGDLAGTGGLADNARAMLPSVAALVDAARSRDIPVVHCLKIFRRDGRGRNRNIALYKRRGLIDSEPAEPDPRAREGTEVVPELGPDPRDVVLARLHGMSAVSDGGVDPLLRTFGATTVVVVGISVNVGVMNTVMDLVNRSYEVVVPRDCVAGVPRDYADAAIEHTIKALATVTTSSAVIEAWSSPS